MSSENYRVNNQNATYFLTFTVTDWVDVFTRLNYRNIIVDSLEYCVRNKGLRIFAWCLMTNHIHIGCMVDEPFKMSDFVRDFKQFTAKSLLKEIQSEPESRRDWMLYRFEYAGKFDNRIKQYRFWQDKSHPIELNTLEMINERIDYIHNNPVKNGLVAEPEDYLFSSARNYAGLSSVIDVEVI